MSRRLFFFFGNEKADNFKLTQMCFDLIVEVLFDSIADKDQLRSTITVFARSLNIGLLTRKKETVRTITFAKRRYKLTPQIK